MSTMTETKQSNMEKEILEQAVVLENLFKANVDNSGNFLFKVPENINKVVFVASGSSFHCAKFASDLFGKVASIEADAIYSSQFLLKSVVPQAKDMMYVFITQSGETSDTNEALRMVKALGMPTVSITNKKDSTIWKNSDYQMDCMAGEENSIAATKSLTTQMMCCALLVLKFAAQKGVDVSKHLNELRAISSFVNKAYGYKDEVKDIAKYLSKFSNIVVTGDDMSFAVAKETSLKIKETSYVNVYSSFLGEFMHGHCAVLNNGIPHVHISLEKMNPVQVKNLVSLANDYNAPTFVLGYSDEQLKPVFNINVECESLATKVICTTIVVQMIALEIATALGRDIDNPHGLHKVVK